MNDFEKPSFPRTDSSSINDLITMCYQHLTMDCDPATRASQIAHLNILEDLRDFRFHSERADVSLNQRDALIDALRRQCEQEHGQLMVALEDVYRFRTHLGTLMAYIGSKRHYVADPVEQSIVAQVASTLEGLGIAAKEPGGY